MLPFSCGRPTRGRRSFSPVSSANTRRVKTLERKKSSKFYSFRALFQTMKKGKKRKFADTQSSVIDEKKRKSGSGSGQTSYLHLKLEIGEGGREADLSPEYVENHLIMALK